MKAKVWRSRRKYSGAGFTLLELLVVIIIIAVLFAIATTGWSAIMNRSRINTVREQVTQTLRQAQNDARRSRIPRVVVFDPNPTGTPRVAILAQGLDATGKIATVPIATTGINNWQTLGNGDIKSGVLELSTVPASASGQLVFDSSGAIAKPSIDKAGGVAATDENKTPNPRLFSINVQQKNTSVQTRRCVVVTTLLGSTRLAEGSDCPAS